MDPVEEILQHHGIKGMKWGVRRQSSSSGGGSRGDRKTAKRTAKSERQLKRADKRWEKNAGRMGDYLKVYNAAADRMNATEIVRINNKPQYKGKNLNKAGPLRDKYYKEYADTFTKALNDSSTALVGTNASGTKKLVFHQDAQLQGFPTAQIVDVNAKHAAGDLSEPVDVKMTHDALGHILSFEIVSPMAQGEDLVADVLSHHGIKGMKWGVRRNGARGKGSAHPESDDSKKAGAARAKIGRKGSTKALSNDELKALVNRMNMEQQYSKLTAGENKSKLSKGHDAVKGILSVANTANQVVTVANSPLVKSLKKS